MYGWIFWLLLVYFGCGESCWRVGEEGVWSGEGEGGFWRGSGGDEVSLGLNLRGDLGKFY